MPLFPPRSHTHAPTASRAEAIPPRTGIPQLKTYSPVLAKEGRLTDSWATNPYHTACGRPITLRDCMETGAPGREQPTRKEPMALRELAAAATTRPFIWLARAGRHERESGYTCMECRLSPEVAFDAPVLMFTLLQLILVEPNEP
jgi:hypothetical protein